MTLSKRTAVWLVGLVAASATIGAVSAPTAAAKKRNTFAGSCSVQGTVHFLPPATNFQQSLDVTYDAQGTCSGTLNGSDVSEAPVSMHNHVENVDGSCLHADTTEPGQGAMFFPGGERIRYTFEFHYVSTEGENTLYGQRSGTAHGHGTFFTPRTPPDVTVQCATTGAEWVPMDFSFTTDTPLVG